MLSWPANAGHPGFEARILAGETGTWHRLTCKPSRQELGGPHSRAMTTGWFENLPPPAGAAALPSIEPTGRENDAVLSRAGGLQRTGRGKSGAPSPASRKSP